jgi:hypothetical protein
MKNTEIKITARNNSAIGFVKYGLLLKKDGRLKSLVPGGVKPSPDKRRLSTEKLLKIVGCLGKQANLIENSGIYEIGSSVKLLAAEAQPDDRNGSTHAYK